MKLRSKKCFRRLLVTPQRIAIYYPIHRNDIFLHYPPSSPPPLRRRVAKEQKQRPTVGMTQGQDRVLLPYREETCSSGMGYTLNLCFLFRKGRANRNWVYAGRMERCRNNKKMTISDRLKVAVGDPAESHALTGRTSIVLTSS